jgi:hypothetical protein
MRVRQAPPTSVTCTATLTRTPLNADKRRRMRPKMSPPGLLLPRRDLRCCFQVSTYPPLTLRSLPKPCVAGSIPAGGTTTHQEKPAWTSTSVGQGRSCVLPPSVAIRPSLPPFAKPLRNGRTAWRCPRSPGFVPLTGKTPSVRAHGRSRPSVAVDVAMDVVGALRPEPGSVVAERRDRPSTRVGCCSVSARVMA